MSRLIKKIIYITKSASVFLVTALFVFTNIPFNQVSKFISDLNIVDSSYLASINSNVVDNLRSVPFAYAADGSGTNAVTPTSVEASTTGNTFTFTYTASETMDSGGMKITVPSGWSAPQGVSGTAGYTTASSVAGMVANVISDADALSQSDGTWVEDDTDACNTANIAVSSAVKKEGTNSIMCNNSASAAADDTDSFAFRYTNTSNWSSYTKLSAWVYVTKAMTATNYIQLAYDDTSGMTTPLQTLNLTTLAASTWTYVTMNLTATRTAVKEVGIICKGAGCDSDYVYIDYVLAGPGQPTFSGAGPWNIDVQFMNLANTQTVSVVYGSGGGTSGVTASGTTGNHTFTTQSRISASGTLTNIASHPVINVTAPSNTAPSATAPGSISQATDNSGYISFQTTVSDPELNNTKLKTECSPNNGTNWYDNELVSAVPSAGTVDLNNSNAYQIGTTDAIDTSGGNVTLTINWNSKTGATSCNLNNTYNTQVKIRVTPNDSLADGTIAESTAFTVDDRTPQGLTSFSSPSKTANSVALQWNSGITEDNTNANFNKYVVCYGTSDPTTTYPCPGSTWDNVDDAALTTISTTGTTVTGLTTGTTYYFHFWAVDDFGNRTDGGLATVSSVPNTMPSATAPVFVSQATDGSGKVTFNTAVSDTDSHNSMLKIEYSDDNGVSWFDPFLDTVGTTVSSGTVDTSNANVYQIGTADKIDSSGGSITVTPKWDTQSVSNGNGVLTGDQTDVKVRVTPSDTYDDGVVQPSNAFEVDNQTPSTPGSFAAPTSNSSSVDLTWTASTETNWSTSVAQYVVCYGTSDPGTTYPCPGSTWDKNNDAALATKTTAGTTVTGLSGGVTYYFHIHAIDNFGNRNASATTASKATTGIAPSISSLNQRQDNQGTAISNGGYATSTQVDFTAQSSSGTTGGTMYLQVELVINAGSFTSPAGSISGCVNCYEESNGVYGGGTMTLWLDSNAILPTLTDGVSYKWQARVRYNTGSDYYSAWTVFNATTPNFIVDASGPVISSVCAVNPSASSCDASSPTDVQAQIRWSTDESANEQVIYGTGACVGISSTQPASPTGSGTTHSVVLSNLSSSSTYYYRVRSADSAGNISYSPSASTCNTFTTSAAVNRLMKTNEYFISQYQNVFSGTDFSSATTTDFDIFVSELDALNSKEVTVKSAYIEVFGVGKSSANYAVQAGVNSQTAVLHNIASSGTNAVPFYLLYKVNAGTLNFDYPADETATNTLTISWPTAPDNSVSLLGARLILTYYYTP